MPILLTRQAWQDQQVLDYVATQLDHLFKGVEPRHQRRLLQLSRDSKNAQTTVADLLRRLHQQTEQIAVDLLALELRKVAGYPIDPRTALLHTRSRRSPRAVEEGSEPDKIISKTLWAAALENFGFDISHGTGSGLGFTDNSYLTAADGTPLEHISLNEFVRIVRELDLGEQIASNTGTQIETRIAPALHDHCRAQVEFDLIHGHCLDPALLSADELDGMISQITDSTQHWTRYDLKSGSQSLSTPFFIRQLPLQTGDPIYSYVPGRPGGAWRRHPSLQSATDSLLQQIRDGAKSGSLEWLLRQLPLAEQHTLATQLNAQPQDLKDFTWLAKQLYTLFADQRSPSERLTIATHNIEIKSLTQAVQDLQSVRFYGDITRLATSTAAADRKTLTRGLEYVVSETLEMILLPLPGGLLGAGRLVLVAMLGSLAYQTVSAILARQDGESAAFIQAMSDILDLLISARLQGVAARLSQQRSRQLMTQLGNPRVIGSSGEAKTLQWLPAADLQTPAPSRPTELDLLRKMLSASGATFTPKTLQRCLRLVPLARAGLESIWNENASTLPALTDLLIGEQLRSEFDAVSHALQRDSALPALANELLPTLLARELNVRVWIYETHTEKYSGRYAPNRPNSAAPTELGLSHIGHRRYRSQLNTSAASGLSLFEAIIEEYDRQQPNNTVGKQGDFSADAHLHQRAAVLSKQIQARLKNELHGLYLQWLAQRLEQDSGQAKVQMGTGLARHRVTGAITTISDPQGRGAAADATHLTLAMLITLPGWPADLAVNLYEARLDHSGQLRAGTHLIHSYGAADASVSIDFARLGSRHVGVDQHTGDMIQAREGDYALVDLILRTLTDPQRDAIGHGLHDAGKLSEFLINLALLERAELQDLFPEPIRVKLSAERLAPFAQVIDLSSQPADSRELYTDANKLYVCIEGRFYQVLHDLEASRPDTAVMRIVRSIDDVAQAPDNRYIAMRAGQSEPIARNGAGEWQGIVVGLAGGMPPKRHGPRVAHSTRLTRDQAMTNLDRTREALQAAEDATSGATTAMRRADVVFNLAVFTNDRASTPQTRAALLKATRDRVPLMRPLLERRTVVFEAQNAMANALDDYQTTILRHDTEYRAMLRDNYQWLCLERIKSVDQLALLNILIATADSEKLTDDPVLHPEEFIQHREIHLQMLEKNRLLALQREADVQALRGVWATPDAEARLAEVQPKQPIASYYVKVAQLQFNGDILAVGSGTGPSRFNFHITTLTTQFRENAIALKTVDEIVPEQRIALLDGIEREFENLHQSLVQLSQDLDPGPRRDRAERMAEIAKEFETLSRTQLSEALAAQSDTVTSERLGGDLDLEFLPPQPGPRPQPAKPRKRVIRLRRRGVNSLAVGEIRDMDGQKTIAVVSPESGGVVQTYKQDADGAWQQVVSVAPAATEVREQQHLAAARLSQVPAHLDRARQMHARKDNPTNIVEMLERHANGLLELASDLPALADELREAAATLSAVGRTSMIERYKDPATQDVHRLRFLIEANEVEVYHTTKRLARGKGKNRYYLDVYEIRDVNSRAELWHAHFHYPKADSPDDGYPLRGGHLKTLEQSRLGREHQAQQEQAGTPVERIWRQEIDRDTSRKLFAKAAPNE